MQALYDGVDPGNFIQELKSVYKDLSAIENPKDEESGIISVLREMEHSTILNLKEKYSGIYDLICEIENDPVKNKELIKDCLNKTDVALEYLSEIEKMERLR